MTFWISLAVRPGQREFTFFTRCPDIAVRFTLSGYGQLQKMKIDNFFSFGMPSDPKLKLPLEIAWHDSFQMPHLLPSWLDTPKG